MKDEPLPVISDEDFDDLRSRAREYTLVVLKTTARTFASDSLPVIWEHGRRSLALRAAGILSIVCPVTDGGDIAGFGLFSGSIRHVNDIMDSDRLSKQESSPTRSTQPAGSQATAYRPSPLDPIGSTRAPLSSKPPRGPRVVHMRSGGPPVNITIVGAGHIGGNIARLLSGAGHAVTVSFARELDKLERLSLDIAGAVAAPDVAVRHADAVVIAVPWGPLPEALEQVGSLTSKIVIDTTNQFGAGPSPQTGQTAAAFNAARIRGARYTKSFNTLTAAFQSRTAGREPRVVQWFAGDDAEAKLIVAELIRDAGFESAARPTAPSSRRRAGTDRSTARSTGSQTRCRSWRR